MIDEMQDRLDKSLSRVLNYFEINGIRLSYMPSIKYLDKMAPDPGATMIANIDPEISIGLGTRIKSIEEFVLYENILGLRISGDAKEEAFKVSFAKEVEKHPGGILDGETAKILAYKPLEQLVNAIKGTANKERLLDCLLVHEVWHLIEEDYDLLDDRQLNFEGTATYVGYRFQDFELPDLDYSNEDYNYYLYVHAAHMVKDEVDHLSDPLRMLLEHGRRIKLNEKFESTILPSMISCMEKDYGRPEVRERLRKDIAANADFKSFVSNPSKRTLCDSFRKQGYMLLARDFERQDISGLVNFYKVLLDLN